MIGETGMQRAAATDGTTGGGALPRRRLSPAAGVVLVALVPVALRLLLLPVLPVPSPGIHDEFGYLLAADTFAHGRLANPASPFGEFFESFHVLIHPVYASMYAPGQGLVLALGQVATGLPWAGVLLAVAAMCGAVTWLFQAFLPPRWSLAGGLAFSLLYGVEHYFANSYWGGALPAAAGALLLGAIARIVRGRPGPPRRVRWSLLAGLGASGLMLTRPWEGFCAGLPAAVMLVVWLFREKGGTLRARLAGGVLPAASVLLAALGWLLYYDLRVTGDPFTPPYLLNLRRYYVAPLFVWQDERPAPDYPNETMRRFYTGWRESERSLRQVDTKSPLVSLAIWLRDFKIVSGAVAAGALLLILRRRAALPLFFAGTFLALVSLQTVRLFHYLAPALGGLALLVLMGLRALGGTRARGGRIGRRLGRRLPAVVLAAAAIGLVRNAALTLHEMATVPRVGFRERRADVAAALAAMPGRQLVFVRYGPDHDVHAEWVYNGADLEGSKVLFAHDLSPEKNTRLLGHDPTRTAWLLLPDEGNALVPYPRR
ncbi:MAG TPA: hypothetical protein VLH41_05060 [Thermoanaerobaculia bacterium]|nr:hypothetical protein [Thermoanaerobaculia bacterium]